MQYAIKYTNRFRKDVKKAKKRGYDIALLEEAIEILQAEGCLPSRYKPHILSGKYAGKWECHLKPDWLLVWNQNDDELTLLFLGTGTHSDLF